METSNTFENCDFYKDNDNCHQKVYLSKTKVPSIVLVHTLEEEDRCLLKLRCRSIEFTEATKICLHHKQVFLTYFNKKVSRMCCDVWNIHKGKVKGTKMINIKVANKHPSLNLIPGYKVCAKCWMGLVRTSKKGQPDIDVDDEEKHKSDEEEDSTEYSRDEEFDNLNKSLTTLGESPVKLNRSLQKRKVYGSNKVAKLAAVVSRKISTVLQVDVTLPTQSVDVSQPALKSEYYQKLMEDLKHKFESCTSKAERIQILTLAPDSWTTSETKSFFCTTRHAVLTAHSLKASKGILSKPSSKQGNRLKEVVREVISFYEDPSVSRCCSGAKQTVSIRTDEGKQLKPKHLMLVALKEAYQMFRNALPHLKIGLSSFASLRPKWCVLPGASGSHNVCICTYHQNTKLMIDAAGIPKSYKDLFQIMVCSSDNVLCMFD